MSYPAYARPQQYVDIPAYPGYRVRQNFNDPSHSQWYDVIAWRLDQDPNSPQIGFPIVLGQYGIEQLTGNSLTSLEFLFPGQEVPE